MANRIVDDGIFVFDQDHASDGRAESISAKDFIVGIISNRFAVLGFAYIVFGMVILVLTATLQFSGASDIILSTDSGVPRQYSVPAPRGNIYDRNGLVLASTEEVNTLLIANAGMDTQDLNEMLLELSYLFDSYNVTTVSGLDAYFSIDPFAFERNEEQILLWQMGRNLFNLLEAPPGAVVTYNDDYVKQDPQVFFLYLRYRFNIDGAYSTDEAYRIIRLRYQIFSDNWAFQTGTPVQIATDVPESLVHLILEQNYNYLGIIASKDYRRVYSPLAKPSAHVIGYVGRISQERHAELSDMGYSLTDIIGQSGIESQMERYLHGQIGRRPYNIWSEDGSEGAFYPADMGIDPVPGANVYLTIDSTLQQAGLEAIKQYIEDAANSPNRQPGYRTASAGAFVVLDVRNGEILAMGSYPDFDPTDFVLAMEGDLQANEQLRYYLGIDDYQEITAEDMPLWNRAIMSQYAPGSTFKMVTALAALERGVITPYSNTITCNSPVDIGGWEFRCLEHPIGGHGDLTLVEALATSCNIYFQELGVMTGIDYIDAMGQTLGLGEITGIDLPGEISGIRASRETKRLLREVEFDRIWMPADTAQSAIGQFDNCFTILQLAQYTAAIATNHLVSPHVIREVISEDGTVLYSGNTDVVPLNLDEANLEIVRRGMRAVSDSPRGTVHRYLHNFPVSLASKTGTAETGFEDFRMEYSNGLLVCYAPADDPEIAIALVVERGEWGSSTAVIAEQILLAYFDVPNPNLETSQIPDPPIGDIQ